MRVIFLTNKSEKGFCTSIKYVSNLGVAVERGMFPRQKFSTLVTGTGSLLIKKRYGMQTIRKQASPTFLGPIGGVYVMTMVVAVATFKTMEDRFVKDKEEETLLMLLAGGPY